MLVFTFILEGGGGGGLPMRGLKTNFVISGTIRVLQKKNGRFSEKGVYNRNAEEIQGK